jgi:hypothetical protein
MKEWLKSALIRAIKTMAQTAVALIGTSQFISQVDWTAIGSAVLLAGILSILTSTAGLPEVQDGASVTSLDTNGKHASTDAVEVDATPATQSTTLTQEEAEALLADVNVKAEGTD